MNGIEKDLVSVKKQEDVTIQWRHFSLLQEGGSMYITKQGQAWDQIAKDVYGKEIYADFLMQSNPTHLNIFVFPAGVELKTPPLLEARKDLPPWR